MTLRPSYSICGARHAKSNALSIFFNWGVYPLKLVLIIAIFVLATFFKYSWTNCTSTGEYTTSQRQLVDVFWILCLMRVVSVSISPIFPTLRLLSNLGQFFTSCWQVVEIAYYVFEYVLALFYFGIGCNMWMILTCTRRYPIMSLFFVDISVLMVCDTVKWSIVWFLCCVEGSNEPIPVEEKSLLENQNESNHQSAHHDQRLLQNALENPPG